MTVQHNTFQFNPSDSIYSGQCTEANACGQNALFSTYSSTPAYPVWSVCNKISNNQNDHFKNNTYTGPWTFTYFNQGDMEGPPAWQAGATTSKARVTTSEPRIRGAPSPRRGRSHSARSA